MIITKGDLLDQQRKLDRSGLADYFEWVEIVSDKTETVYSRLAYNPHNLKSESICNGRQLITIRYSSCHSDWGACNLIYPMRSPGEHDILIDHFDNPRFLP